MGLIFSHSILCFPGLLRYNRHRTLFTFQVYNVMILYMCIVRNYYHNKISENFHCLT